MKQQFITIPVRFRVIRPKGAKESEPVSVEGAQLAASIALHHHLGLIEEDTLETVKFIDAVLPFGHGQLRVSLTELQNDRAQLTKFPELPARP